MIKMAWPKESRRHGLARKGIPTVIDQGRRFDMSNFVARGRKLARLTPEEEHAWDFAWTFYEDEYPDENIRAGVVWRDLQIEFPRLKDFDGIASGKSKERFLVKLFDKDGNLKLQKEFDEGHLAWAYGENWTLFGHKDKRYEMEKLQASGRKAKFGISYGKDKRMIWKINNRIASFSSEEDANSVIREMIPRFKYHNPRVIKLDEEQTEDAVELGDTALLIV